MELTKYNTKVALTATTRVGVSEYSFPKGQANILLNLGLGLTNEQGAMVKIVSPTEIEGMRSVGSFCYNSPEKAYPVYFAAKFSLPAEELGVWKTPHTYEGVEAQWMPYNGKTRLMKNCRNMVVGDSIGTYFSYHFKKPTKVTLKVGVSYVSIENARENLEKETNGKSFEQLYAETKQKWNDILSRIEVKGGTEEDKKVFYTALYHTQIHPNILNDYNGEFPEIGTGKIGKTESVRYTVFSLWDTYRNYHQLMSLVYPEQQLDMVKSMLQMYDENGWLPKWELNSTETFTMVGDPASVVIADTYLRGITDFDTEKAYQAMLKGATQLENNPLRLGLKEYLQNGYVSVDSGVAGPVSVTQEYNMADYAIAQMAQKLGKTIDYQRFYKQSLSYKKLFDKETKLLRPKYSNGKWYEPFNPYSGANFEKNVGYIEGNAFQYAFMIPHDIKGLIKLMGGEKKFAKKLDKLFADNQYDMANEPDIAYPFLFNYCKGYEWKTQQKVKELINKYFTNQPKGLPGNDDTGTMSAWVVFSMMGIYPITPADPSFTLTKPTFSEIKIHLNKKYYQKDLLTIKTIKTSGNNNGFIKKITLDGKEYKNYFIDQNKLINEGTLNFYVK